MTYEFGGPWGVTFLIVWSHWILYYFWYCLQFHSGTLYLPLSSFHELLSFPSTLYSAISTHALPTAYSLTCYSIFLVFQVIIGHFMPGFVVYGFPIAKQNNRRLPYLINGYYCYYFTIFVFLLLEYCQLFKLSSIASNFGCWLSTSIVLGDLTSIWWYVYGFITKQTEKLSGNHVYDLFMGSLMYPRIGRVDIKMMSELRWSWLLLLLLTMSCALRQFEEHGAVSPQLVFMIVAHWLYSNATVKGEHCVPYFWDMYHEKYGWMLNFWNITGVPFLYCFQSMFIVTNSDYYVHHNYSILYIAACYAVLLLGYYIWDVANAQKAYFKQPDLRRYETKFPRFRQSYIANAKVIKTPNGNLLVDGCWKYARKMNYCGDILMALSWGLITGFHSMCCYFYVSFFVVMILHRQYYRDEPHCLKKYGKYWIEYKKKVPYLLIPYII